MSPVPAAIIPQDRDTCCPQLFLQRLRLRLQGREGTGGPGSDGTRICAGIRADTRAPSRAEVRIDPRLLIGGWDTSRSQPAGVQINAGMHRCICKAGLVLARTGHRLPRSASPSVSLSVRQLIRLSGLRRSSFPSPVGLTKRIRFAAKAGRGR